MKFKYTPEECYSTHCISYAINSYWDGNDIICGACGYRIVNPEPTGGKFVVNKGLVNFLLNRGHYEPIWPEWLFGERGKKMSDWAIEKFFMEQGYNFEK